MPFLRFSLFLPFSSSLPAIYSVSEACWSPWVPSSGNYKDFTCFLLYILHHFNHWSRTFYPLHSPLGMYRGWNREPWACHWVPPIGFVYGGLSLVFFFLHFLSFLKHSKGTPGRECNICCGLQGWWNKVARGKCCVWFWNTVLSLSTCVPWPGSEFNLHQGRGGENVAAPRVQLLRACQPKSVLRGPKRLLVFMSAWKIKNLRIAMQTRHRGLSLSSTHISQRLSQLE